MSRYRVDTRVVNGWEDCWTADGLPWRFDTRKEAQDEIDDHVEATNDAVAAGFVDSGCCKADFNIVKMEADELDNRRD